MQPLGTRYNRPTSTRPPSLKEVQSRMPEALSSANPANSRANKSARFKHRATTFAETAQPTHGCTKPQSGEAPARGWGV